MVPAQFGFSEKRVGERHTHEIFMTQCNSTEDILLLPDAFTKTLSKEQELYSVTVFWWA